MNTPLTDLVEREIPPHMRNEYTDGLAKLARAFEEKMEDWDTLLAATTQSWAAFTLTLPLLEGTKFDFPALSCRQGLTITAEALTKVLGPDFEALITAESASEDGGP